MQRKCPELEAIYIKSFSYGRLNDKQKYTTLHRKYIHRIAISVHKCHSFMNWHLQIHWKRDSDTVWCLFLLNDSSLSPHKFIFKTMFFPLYSGAFTLLNLHYLYLLIIINYPRSTRCVIANQLTSFYMSPCKYTFSYCERYFRWYDRLRLSKYSISLGKPNMFC